MTITYSILPDRPFVLVYCSGIVTFDECVEVFEAYIADPRARLPHWVAVDLAGVAHIDLSFRELLDLVERLHRTFSAGGHPLRLAIAASRRAERAMVRALEVATAGNRQFAISLHGDIAAAASALTRAPPHRRLA